VLQFRRATVRKQALPLALWAAFSTFECLFNPVFLVCLRARSKDALTLANPNNTVGASFQKSGTVPKFFSS
jgi:hypothetical protein